MGESSAIPSVSGGITENARNNDVFPSCGDRSSSASRSFFAYISNTTGSSQQSFTTVPRRARRCSSALHWCWSFPADLLFDILPTVNATAQYLFMDGYLDHH